MEEIIEVLVVEPGKRPVPERMENTLQAMKKRLGGSVQIGCFLPQKVIMVSRSDRKELVPNRNLPGKKELIMGAFLLCGIPKDGKQFVSLSDLQKREFEALFSEPGEYMKVGEQIFSDQDDVADAVYKLWDTMTDGEKILLAKIGGKIRKEAV